MSRNPPTFFLLLLLLMATVLTGCATPAPRAERMQLPELKACAAPVLPPKPTLPLANLPLDASDDETLAAYAESLRQCALYSKQLEIALKAYTNGN